jgi:hypothetical protein
MLWVLSSGTRYGSKSVEDLEKESFPGAKVKMQPVEN